MSTNTADTPVLVVGAGPVGSVLALELARQLLDRFGLCAEIRARGVASDQLSMQSHPESLLTKQGSALLAEHLTALADAVPSEVF